MSRKILGDPVKDLQINEEDLEGEWSYQPSVYNHYGELWAEANEEKEMAKLRVDWVESDIDADIRENPEKYGFEKSPTETAIKAAIKRSKEYKEAQKKAVLANTIANKLLINKTSFEHRKKALENKVTLLVSGFHSEPRNKIRDLKEMKAKANHREHTKKLNKRKKSNT